MIFKAVFGANRGVFDGRHIGRRTDSEWLVFVCGATIAGGGFLRVLLRVISRSKKRGLEAIRYRAGRVFAGFVGFLLLITACKMSPGSTCAQKTVGGTGCRRGGFGGREKVCG